MDCRAHFEHITALLQGPENHTEQREEIKQALGEQPGAYLFRLLYKEAILYFIKPERDLFFWGKKAILLSQKVCIL